MTKTKNDLARIIAALKVAPFGQVRDAELKTRLTLADYRKRAAAAAGREVLPSFLESISVLEKTLAAIVAELGSR